MGNCFPAGKGEMSRAGQHVGEPKQAQEFEAAPDASTPPDSAPGAILLDSLIRGWDPSRQHSFPRGLCAFDIDGTIRRSDGTISPRLKTALKALREQGCAVVLATGRPPFMASSIPGLVDNEIDFVICCNGGQLYNVAGATSSSDWVEVMEPLKLSREAVKEVGEAVLAAHPSAEFSLIYEHTPTTAPRDSGTMCSMEMWETAMPGQNMPSYMSGGGDNPDLVFKPAIRKPGSEPIWWFTATVKGMESAEVITKVTPTA